MKFRIRIAKVVLRGVNFCCSLVVLALISSALYIFHKTSQLPARNGLPPWASGSATWPQITLCCIAAVSLFLCLSVLYGYWRGGHRRAEKASIYVTAFSIASFIFAIVMWGIAAGILNGTRAAGNGQDIWGWACKDNKRRQLFQEDINYVLVCKELVCNTSLSLPIFGKLTCRRIGDSSVLSLKSRSSSLLSVSTLSPSGVSPPSASSASPWTSVTVPAPSSGSQSSGNKKPQPPTMRMKLKRTLCIICPKTHTLPPRKEWPQHRNNKCKLLVVDSSSRRSRRLGITSLQCRLLLAHRLSSLVGGLPSLSTSRLAMTLPRSRYHRLRHLPRISIGSRMRFLRLQEV